MTLTSRQRRNLFLAELTLARVNAHLWNRLHPSLPAAERDGLLDAMSLVGTLYRAARAAQEEE